MGVHGCERMVLFSDIAFEDAHRLYLRFGFRNHRFRYAPDPWQSREWGFELELSPAGPHPPAPSPDSYLVYNPAGEGEANDRRAWLSVALPELALLAPIERADAVLGELPDSRLGLSAADFEKAERAQARVQVMRVRR